MTFSFFVAKIMNQPMKHHRVKNIFVTLYRFLVNMNHDATIH
ncbi:hypothetical protein SAMN04487899_10587 [Segatella bryantii]|jgi:hypothetical protein|nr:hypothetical protein SAMN04487899_10587 [Segatella bryantii]